MSPKQNDAPKLRMDSYSKKDQNNRSSGVLNTRREIDKVIKKARQDGVSKRDYWAKKVLEVEEKEQGRWHHSGYRKLYVDADRDSRSASGSPRSKRSGVYSPSARTSPAAAATARVSRYSTTPDRGTRRRSLSSDAGRGSPRSRTDRFANSRRQVSRSPLRRARSPVRRTYRSPVRRTKPAATRRSSPLRRSCSRSRSRSVSPRARKLSARREKSPLSRAVRQDSTSSRPPKANRARNRSNDGVSPVRQRKKSPRTTKYKDMSESPAAAPVRRSQPHSPSPVQTRVNKHNKFANRTKNRDSSSSATPINSGSPQKKRRKKTKNNQIEILSSTDCSESDCSMCRFEKGLKDRKHTRSNRSRKERSVSPADEPIIEPSTALSTRLPLPSSSRYARSRSLSAPKETTNFVEEHRVEPKRKKKKKEKRNKDLSNVLAKIKVEPPSDESDSPSPKRMTLSERFGKMSKLHRAKRDTELTQPNNVRLSSGDSFRIEEDDRPSIPSFEPIAEAPLLLHDTWDDARVRYAYYKEQGYLEDLSFQDYLKWEEWWYGYQKWMDTERLHLSRGRL